MFCPQCGAPQEADAIYCSNCGAVLDPDTAPAPGVEGTPLAEPREEAAGRDALLIVPPSLPSPPSPPPLPRGMPATSGLAIASLVMGIVGWTVLPLIGSVLAIIFGYMARNEIRQRPGEVTGDGLALAGIVLGWLMVGASVLLLCVGGLSLCFFAGAWGAAAS